VETASTQLSYICRAILDIIFRVTVVHVFRWLLGVPSGSYAPIHMHNIIHTLYVLSLQPEPGSSDPSPSGPLLSPGQPLPPLDLMKGMPSDITAHQQVNMHACIMAANTNLHNVPKLVTSQALPGTFVYMYVMYVDTCRLIHCYFTLLSN
jgi:hypothetical protein